LTQSLRIDPNNEIAWMWLSRTLSDKQKQQQCLERVLQINPNNEQARALMQRLNGSGSNGAAAPPVKPAVARTKTPPPAARTKTPVPAGTIPAPEPSHSPAQKQQIRALLKQADSYIEKNDAEAAIEQWVRVLEIEPDHEEALANAVRHLSRLKYIDDARELVWNAINKGTTHPSVYLTAIDIARYQKNDGEADDLRLKLAELPAADEELISSMSEHFFRRGQEVQAISVLRKGIQNHPKSQKLLLRLADLAKEQGNAQEAMILYDQAARLGASTKEGKAADQKLLEFAPALTDKERGSTVLAVREAAGFGLVALLMAWQDAGLDLLQLGINRWIGVLVSIIGGYLLITATSSPQQQPLARWLGGVVPEPPEKPENDFEAMSVMPEYVSELPAITLPFRLVFGTVGMVMLALAFYLVFSTAIGLISNPNPPEFYIISCAEVFEVADLC
jgi:tetratricopeptide (TPR) repeat protein